MKLTILNKNRINDSGSYELNNLKSFTIDAGFNLVRNLNKTLNSVKLRISHIADNIDIEPLDEVLLNDDSRFNNIYMCVEDYTKIQEHLDSGNITYTYDISLCSQIKKLEGIMLPNIAITPLKIGTKRSIYDYLQQYLDEYGEKFRTENVFENCYTYSQRLIDRFSLIECPELQWNTPTLREVIDDLLMVDNCIATLNNGIIDYVDLENLENQQEITNYNFITESRSLEDYVSEIKMEMKNGLQNEIANVKNVVSTTEYIHITTESEDVIKTDNFLFKTQFPILNITKLIMKIPLKEPNSANDVATWYEVDLTQAPFNLVVERQEFITRQALASYTNITYTNAKQYQNTSLYFTRGDNKILGFNNLTRANFLQKYNAYEYLLKIVGEYLNDLGTTQAIADTLTWSLITFYIEYETIAQETFSASKTDYPNNYRQIIDNQTNSWVNVNTQGKLEYSKANRLGNVNKIISQRYKNVGNLMKIADYYEDYIVYQTNYSIYDDYIDVKGVACKNYVLKDYFTGINSKIRTWVNAENEAFYKNILIKYYLEISNRKIDEYVYNGKLQLNNYPLHYFLTPIRNIDYTIPFEKYNLPIREALVMFRDSSQILLNDKFLSREINSKIVGNSIVFNFVLDNNAYLSNISNFGNVSIAYTQPKTDPQQQDGVNVGGYWQHANKYVNENYEFTDVNIYLLNGSKMLEYDKNNIDGTTLSNQYKEIVDLPTVSTLIGYMEGKEATLNQWQQAFKRMLINYTNRKDNKEIPNYAIQLEFSSENRDMYLTETFIKRQQCIATLSYGTQPKYIYLGNYVYGKKKVDINDTLDSGASIVIDSDGKVNVNLSLEKGNNAIYITTENGEIMIGLKEATTFYLNILKDKRKTIYNNNRVKIGEL